MLNALVRQPDTARFGMCGTRPAANMTEVHERLSKGLVDRLQRHAERELNARGFGELTKGAKATVYTIEPDGQPADRAFCVRWHAPRGGYVEFRGKLTKAGWPALDNSCDIGFVEPNA